METNVSLHELRENIRELLVFILHDHSESDDAHAICITAHWAANYHNNLAILDYLLDADDQSFYKHLYQAARCRLYYLGKRLAGLEKSASYDVATVDKYFFCGIASSYINVARTLSRVMRTKKHSRLDSFERFAYSTLIRLLIDKESSEQLIKTHSEAIHFADHDDSRLRCALAISDHDHSAFVAAFWALLEHRSWEIETNVVTNVPDRLIFVEGLALLRVAGMYDIHIDIDSSMVPKFLLGTLIADPPKDGYLKLPVKDIEKIREKQRKARKK